MNRVVSLALVGVLACGGGSAPSPAELRGSVSVVGNAPLETVIITTDEGRSTGVVGPLKVTIASLSGAVVTVRGPVAAGALPGTSGSITVTGYDVVSVGGIPASMGVLVRDGETVVLAGRARWRLTAVPPALLSRTGRTVWVSGEHQDGSIRVISWGEIRVP